MSLRQEYKKVLKLVEQDGRFTISKSKSNHYHVRSLEGELITVMSSTPSTLRALKNVQGVLRQHGVETNPKRRSDDHHHGNRTK